MEIRWMNGWMSKLDYYRRGSAEGECGTEVGSEIDGKGGWGMGERRINEWMDGWMDLIRESLRWGGSLRFASVGFMKEGRGERDLISSFWG